MIRWWKRRSLRFRLAAWYAIGGTLLLAAFSATVYSWVTYRMALPLDHRLRQDLQEVRANLTVSEDGRVLWKGGEAKPGEPWPPANPWFEIWNEKGELVRRYWPFVDSRLERLPIAPAPNRETISVFSVSQDVRLRSLSVPFNIQGKNEDWMIRVLSIHEPAMNALRELLLIILVALPVVVVLLVLGGYAITRRWLKPLHLMVVEANEIGGHEFQRRLSVQNPHDELGGMATVFNTTLSRLEDSYRALDRFVADAAHELLTPLTTLRSVGEVGLRRARSEDEYREIVGSMLEEAQRLQLLVEKLLQLARAEGGANMLQCAPVKLDELCLEVMQDASVLAEDKGQEIVLRAAPGAAHTDGLLLRQALQNLVDNAIKYSPSGTQIVITLEYEKDRAVISVSDEGPGVPVEHRERLTDRFFRAEASRGRNGGGFGLGLAITKAYMHVLSGGLSYEQGQPRGSRFRVWVPLERSC